MGFWNRLMGKEDTIISKTSPLSRVEGMEIWKTAYIKSIVGDRPMDKVSNELTDLAAEVGIDDEDMRQIISGAKVAKEKKRDNKTAREASQIKPTASENREVPADTKAEVKHSNLDKGRATWKANVEANGPDHAAMLKDQRYVTAYASILQAEACERESDFLTARTCYFRAVESITQYDTLTDGSASKAVVEFKRLYQEFVLDRDPHFKKYLAELLPIIQESPGILQTELYARTPMDKANVSYCLYFADAGGLVQRMKKGRTYQLLAAGNEEKS